MQPRRKPPVPSTPVDAPHPSDERRLLDSLIREVSDARRDIELDLTLAVGATEADHADLAVELLDDSRQRVAALQGTLLDHLAELHSTGAADHLHPDDLVPGARPVAPPLPLPTRSEAVPQGPGWRRALAPLAPLLASAAAVATLLSGSPSPLTTPSTLPMSRTAELQAGFDSLGEVVLRRSDEESVLAAVRRLHSAVRPLVAVAGSDPISAATARSVLLRQRELVRSEQPAGARTALDETDALLSDLGRVGVALPPLQDLLTDLPGTLPLLAQGPARARLVRAERAADASRPVPSPLPTAAVAPERLVSPPPARAGQRRRQRPRGLARRHPAGGGHPGADPRPALPPPRAPRRRLPMPTPRPPARSRPARSRPVSSRQASSRRPAPPRPRRQRPRWTARRPCSRPPPRRSCAPSCPEADPPASSAGGRCRQGLSPSSVRGA